MAREDDDLILPWGARIITWVESMPKILKVVVLLIEFRGVDMNFLYHSCEVILLRDEIICCLEPSKLFMYLFSHQIWHIYFWGRIYW